jgi:hypothetical protein
MSESVTIQSDSAIHFSGELQAAQDRGELVALATVFYRPADDMLVMYFPLSISEEEAVSMLRRHSCFPREYRLPRG